VGGWVWISSSLNQFEASPITVRLQRDTDRRPWPDAEVDHRRSRQVFDPLPQTVWRSREKV
jgi:hypothetical protein